MKHKVHHNLLWLSDQVQLHDVITSSQGLQDFSVKLCEEASIHSDQEIKGINIISIRGDRSTLRPEMQLDWFLITRFLMWYNGFEHYELQ